jgi:hypothetical protein
MIKDKAKEQDGKFSKAQKTKLEEMIKKSSSVGGDKLAKLSKDVE